MEYTKKSFSVGALPSKEYRDSWERIFKPAAFGAGVNHRCPREGEGEIDDHGICDHCKTQNVDTYHKGGLFLCAKCAGLPPKVPAFWTCPDCGGTSSWGAEQLHRCAR